MPVRRGTATHRGCYAPALRTEARYPGLDADAGHYESFFLRTTRPSGGQAIWIRYVIDRSPGAEASASLWLTWFDAGDGLPLAAKTSYPADRLRFPPTGYIAIADASLTPGHATGSMPSESGDLSWDLTFDEGADPYDHLQFAWLYRSPIPRTKLRSPHPSMLVSGVLRLGDRRIDIAGWRGMVGHNWGTEHAEEWVWIDAVGIDGGDGFIDLAAGRLHVGGRLTPWIANGAVQFRGQRHRLGGLARTRSFHLDADPLGASFKVKGGGITVHGRVVARAKDVVTWPYDDPAGGTHEVRNGSIADLDLTIEQTGDTESFSAFGTATYELGRRATTDKKGAR